MDIWNRYVSPSGYHMNDDGTDSLGVNHSNFSLRDEIAYQMNRVNNEERQQSMLPQVGTTMGQTPTPWNNKNQPSMFQTQTQTPTPWRNGTVAQPSAPTSIQQEDVFSQQARRNAENSLLMDGMDTLYGINRTINGMTFGGLDWLGNQLGFDTQMNDYLQLKDPQSRALTQNVGNIVEIGGGAVTGGAITQAAYPPINTAYNSYKIGRAYDKLSQNPYQGKGSDIIARMRNHNGEPVILQRGEAIPGENGQPVVYGNELKRATGTKRNYGLDKGIYKHNITRADAQQIPRIVQQKPVDISPRGQHIYNVPSRNGTFQVVTSPTNNGNVVSSTYYPEK